MSKLRDIEKDTEVIKKFLTKYTSHKPEDVISINRVRANTYRVKIKNQNELGTTGDEKVFSVGFWFTDDGMVYYGIIGRGISCSIKIKSLL